jgi:hypothetical protein
MFSRARSRKPSSFPAALAVIPATVPAIPGPEQLGQCLRGPLLRQELTRIQVDDDRGTGSACAAALAGCRESGELLSLPSLLMLMADLDVQAGRIRDAAAHLREGLQAAMRAGDWFDVAVNGLWYCAMLCAAAGRHAEAVTLWAALDVQIRQQGGSGAGSPGDARRREEAQGTARQALGPDRARAAEERGAAMSLDTAAAGQPAPSVAIMESPTAMMRGPRRRARGGRWSAGSGW